MSISVATDRPTSTRRLAIVGAVLAALALVAVVLAIALSNANSSPGRDMAPTGARGQAAALATTQGMFRDPVTHVLVPITTPTVSDATPGPGHK